MNARTILESLVGPAPEAIDEIVRLIQSSRTWQEANAKLADSGVHYANDSEVLNSTGAIGGYDPDSGELHLNARYFGQLDTERLRTVIEHEMVHGCQMTRAAERGGDPSDIVGRKLKYLFKGGSLNYKAYGEDPLEMQALARNAVTTARRKGQDPKKLMRSGRLARHAPLLPGDTKRFHKYAYQMAERLLGS